MTQEARIRRIGWIVILAVCAALYLGLHLKVHSVKSELVRAERQIVRLEEQNLLLETEFLTRSNQLQLAQWNRVDFGYRPPEASQFITGERQLAMLGSAPRRLERGRPGTGSEIQLASYSPDREQEKDAPARLSPPTGELVEVALLAAAPEEPRPAPRLALVMPQGPTRIQLSALADAAVR